MGTPTNISMAFWNHDRVQALIDGTLALPGYTTDIHVLPTSALFPIAVQEARFDVTELSLSSHILQVSRGTPDYTAVPVFLSRSFRHNGFFKRADSGIATPADFAGRAIGVPEYQMTAALWMRGILSDDYGVRAEAISWRTGALDQGVRRERLALTPPADLSIQPINEGETLQALLLAGEIDGLLAPNPPKAFLNGDPRVERVFPDFEAAERAYFARTGFFPVMHVLAVRDTLVRRHPDLPMLLFDTFRSARDLAMQKLRETWLGSANRLTLPWLNASMESTLKAMGQDYWPYGFTAARTELAAACRYSSEQHLAVRHVSPEELFHPSTLWT